MKQYYFYNFSGRNFPDLSKISFDSMYVVNGAITQTGYELTPPVFGSGIKPVDLNGAIVFPAFSDSHVHFLQTGINKLGLALDEALSIHDLLDMVRDDSRGKDWVLGWNLDETNLQKGKLPTKRELDSASSKAKVFLSRADLHSAVLNTEALKWARKLIPDLTDKDGFVSGKNYGILAYELQKSLDSGMKRKALKTAEQQCFENGVATIHAMEGSHDSILDAKLVGDFLKDSQLNGHIFHQSKDPSLALKMGWKQLGGCILADGSFGTRSAALWEPYSDSSNSIGNLYLEAEDIERLLDTCYKNNLQLAMHAIGDKAIDRVSACYAWAAEKYGFRSIQNRIEHFILPSLKAIRHVKSSNTMISIQPAFDHFWGGPNGLYAQRLGRSRASECNPFRTMLDLGIQLAGGSDSPVTPINPFVGIHALVNHSNPEEQIPLNQAFSLFTSEPHKLTGNHKAKGELKKGYVADFICMDDDPFLTPKHRLKSQKISELYIAGQKVF
jgi:predicted amidohydrolase YtcJ